MEIRKRCALARLYKGPQHPIDETYAELTLMRLACAGDTEGAAALFQETKLFGGAKSAIDTPYKRYEGLQGVRAFVSEWLPRFGAQSAAVVPVMQTRANGRSVTELMVEFTCGEVIDQVPFFVVADLRPRGQLEEVRLYTHCSFVPGLQAYRKPLFTPTHLEMGEIGLMTGAVREYYDALHATPLADVDRLMACMSEDCLFGGYEPDDDSHAPAVTRAELRAKYEKMASYIPRCVGMRYETLIDDGRTCVIEWVHVVSRAGQEERNRLAMSGIAAYERGEDSLLGCTAPESYHRAILFLFPSGMHRACGDIMDLGDLFSSELSDKRFRLNEAQISSFIHWIDEIERRENAPDPSARLADRAALIELMLIAYQAMNDRSASLEHAHHTVIHQVLEYIHHHFTEALTLERLSRQFGVSRSHLSHEFTRQTNHSLYDYILNRRISYARELIAQGRPSMEVAALSGFGEYSNFLRAFKRVTHVTPNEYRQITRILPLTDQPRFFASSNSGDDA